jgi:hypothetical protein
VHDDQSIRDVFAKGAALEDTDIPYEKNTGQSSPRIAG